MKALESTISLLERTVLKRGRVLAVRTWEPDNFVEVDLHLPGTGMSDWQEAQHIKCRVGTLLFRDYTLAGWDGDTRTGTLYIDTGHEGPGARWARTLAPGDTLHYTGAESTGRPPEALSRLVCLGDETSVGHVLALHQLLPRSSSMTGAILFDEPAYRKCFRDFLRLPLEPLTRAEALLEWVSGAPLEDDFFHLTGNHRLVQHLRRILRGKGVSRDRIRVQGFWS